MNDKRVIIAAMIAVVLLCGLGIWWLTMPRYVALMPGHEGSSDYTHTVVGKLMEWGVEYKIEETTGAVLVLDSDLQSIRARLTAMGIPPNNSVGLEAFDKDEYGTSDFVQSVNYQRALEVELARTIRNLDGIRSARVHLTLAKESLFKDREKLAKASVIIEPKDGVEISSSKVAGIKQIVATAVANMEQDQVSILHIDGTPLVVGSMEGGEPREMISFAEHQYRQIVERLLQGIVPPSAIRVGVKVELDATKMTTVREKIIPKNEKGDGFVTKSRASSMPVTGEPRDAEKYKSSEEIDYSFSVEKSEILHPSGSIKRISVGILIVDSAFDEKTFEPLHRVLQSALGINQARGDSLELAVLPLASESTGVFAVPTSGSEAYEPESADEAGSSVSRWHYALLSALAIAAILIVVLICLYIRELKFRNRQALYRFSNDHEREQFVKELKDWLEV